MRFLARILLCCMIVNLPLCWCSVDVICNGWCKDETFHRVEWELEDGEITVYLPPFHTGQQISFRALFSRDYIYRVAPTDTYALRWGKETYPLKDVVKLTVTDGNGVFCLVRTDGSEVKDSRSKPMKGYACRKVWGYLSADGPQASEPQKFAAPELFQLAEYQTKNGDDEYESHLVVRGPFDGDLENTKLEISGHDPTILSECPSQALIAVDSDQDGMALKLKDVRVGVSVIKVRDGDRNAEMTIRFYVMKSEINPTGRAAAGLLRISLFGLPQPPESGLTMVFRVYARADVKTSPDIRKFTRKEIKRRIQNPEGLPDSGERYIVALTEKYLKAGIYQIDIPIRAKDSTAWNGSPQVECALRLLPGPEQIRSSVLSEIDRWQSVNRIAVTPAIQKEIADEFVQAKPAIHEVWESFDREMPSINDFVQHLTSMYLYELRDTPVKSKPTPPVLIERFMAEDATPSRSTISELTISLKDFLKEISNVLFNYAAYVIESCPSGAQIISQDQKLSYATTGKTVYFKLGQYALELLYPRLGTCSCNLSVEVTKPGWIFCDLTKSGPSLQCSVNRHDLACSSEKVPARP